MSSPTIANIRFLLSLSSVQTKVMAGIVKKARNPSSHPQEELSLCILGASAVDHSMAFEKGAVMDIDALSTSIMTATADVEKQAGLEINLTMCLMPSMEAQFEPHQQEIPIKENTVSKKDIAELKARQKPIENFIDNRQCIQTIAYSFAVDQKKNVQNPIGLAGEFLGQNFCHLFYPTFEIMNVENACLQTGIQVSQFIGTNIAAAEGVLFLDEKNFGAASIYIGPDITHITVYKEHLPIYYKDLSMGYRNITKDLSIGLGISQQDALNLEKEVTLGHEAFGWSAKAQNLNSRLNSDIPMKKVVKIINARVEEIFETVFLQLHRQKLLEHLTKGIVVSGACPHLGHAVALSESIFPCTMRVGAAQRLTGAKEGMSHPSWAAEAGAFYADYLYGNPHAPEKSGRKNRKLPFWQRLRNLI